MGLQSPTHFQLPPPQLTKEQLSLSTARLYQESNPRNPHDLNDTVNHQGSFAKERSLLDYTYHLLPNKSRQQLQDTLLEDYLKNSENSCKTCKPEQFEKPLALFTAGGMGAGKSHVLRYLLEQCEVSLPHDFIWVDPDRIARKLPERPQYLEHNPDAASALMLPEAGFLQEVIQNFAMSHSRSMVIDGSFTDGKWNEYLMDKLRAEGFKLDLLFVFADEETMVERAKRRAKTTGRITKPDHVCSSISPPAPASWRADPGPSQIKSSRMKSPLVVRALGRKDIVDRVRLVDNSIDSEPPKIVYDSEQDENWKQGGQVDVDLFMSLRSR